MMSLFGISLGSKKASSNTNSTATKTEDTTQNQTTNTAGTNTTNTSGTSNTSSTGTSTTSQTGTQTQTGTSATTGTTNLFSSGVLSGIENAVSSLFGGVTSGASAANTSTFDPAAYIKDTTTAAQSQQQDVLDSTKGAIADMVGSKLDNSSMATLLAQRAANSAASNVAGITAQAQSTAAGIENQNAQTNLAASTQQGNLLTTLLDALKGGTQTTTQNTGTTQNTASTQDQSTNTSENSSTATNQTAVETIQQLVNALLTGTDNTNATESSSTKGKSTTAGLSIGL